MCSIQEGGDNHPVSQKKKIRLDGCCVVFICTKTVAKPKLIHSLLCTHVHSDGQCVRKCMKCEGNAVSIARTKDPFCK